MSGLEAVLWIGFGLAFGTFLAYIFFVYKRKKVIKNDVQIVMSQLQSVSKLVTVEGEFSEIYQHKEENPMFFNWIKSEKKALLIIKAKVMMGYDLSRLEYSVDATTKTLSIQKSPPAEILSMHMDAEYYDITNGTFNKFSKEDLDKIKEEAKQVMLDKIQESDLPKMVQEQGNQGLELLSNTTKALGWKLDTQS